MEKIKFRLFIFFLWLGACTPTFAQNRNSIWVFGDSSMVDFGNAGSPVTGVSGMDGRGSCVSIADTASNLLFYAFTRALFPVNSGLILSQAHGQLLNSRNIYAGLYYGPVEAKMHSIGFSLLTDSDKRLQYEIALHHSRDFRSLGYRYSYTFKPSINFYFKKRNENSNRLYLTGSLNLFAQYYTRNFELFSLQRTSVPFKRYGYGLLPGLNLFFNINHRVKLTSSITSGPAFYTSYGPECDDTNGLECYEHSPIHYSDLTSYIYFGILLKL